MSKLWMSVYRHEASRRILCYPGFCGCSIRTLWRFDAVGIAKIFKVSDVAVLKWIRQAAAQVPVPKPEVSSEGVMIDEMWHFVNGKKNLYGSGERLMGYRVNLLDGNWALVAIPAFKDLSKKLIMERVTS